MNTLVLGASTKPSRYSYKATQRLLEAGEVPILIGGRKGEIFGLAIQVGLPTLKEIDTVTVYLQKSKQEEYVDYIIDIIKPRRIIFNPGAENPTLARKAATTSIIVIHACTLVLLATGQY